MTTPRDSTTTTTTADQDESSSGASFAHSLAVAPLDTANTIHNISLALNNGSHHHHQHHHHHNNSNPNDLSATGTNDALMTDVTNAVQSSMAAMDQQHQHDQEHEHQQQQQQQQQPAEARMAVAELLVSLAQNPSAQGNESAIGQDTGNVAATAFVSATTGNPSATITPTQQSPIYRNAVDYVGSVKKAYENNPKVYTEFLSALEQYHHQTLPIDQLVRTVMTLFQDQPDLLLGFKEFLPEAQALLNQLIPPMMYSDYKGNGAKEAAAVGSSAASRSIIPSALSASPGIGVQQSSQMFNTNGQNGAAADFLSLIKEKSQQEPDMYQHLINLLRKFQKDHNYANLHFFVSIILRYHPHLLQRFQNFLPSATSGVEVTEPRIISKAPPEELVVSPDFIEAKDFVQTVKLEAKNDMSMYDRFIFALEKYQCNGWTLDQVYSEVSLIFWNHPDALTGFKQFISSVPAPQP